MKGVYTILINAQKKTSKGKLYKVQPDNVKKMRKILKQQKVEYVERRAEFKGMPAISFHF